MARRHGSTDWTAVSALFEFVWKGWALAAKAGGHGNTVQEWDRTGRGPTGRGSTPTRPWTAISDVHPGPHAAVGGPRPGLKPCPTPRTGSPTAGAGDVSPGVRDGSGRQADRHRRRPVWPASGVAGLDGLYGAPGTVPATRGPQGPSVPLRLGRVRGLCRDPRRRHPRGPPGEPVATGRAGRRPDGRGAHVLRPSDRPAPPRAADPGSRHRWPGRSRASCTARG